MKPYLIFCVLPLMVCLAGCQDHNRFSLHGPDIMQYHGEEDVLKNCCSAAMARLAEDIRQEKALDSYPPMHEKTAGWSTTKKSSTDKPSQTTGWRMTLTCDDDDRQYCIEVVWVDDRPAVIIIDRPEGDDRLVKHLTKLFSNFDVALADTL
jgi:hypothetical protein